jgi:hypothetical protein
VKLETGLALYWVLPIVQLRYILKVKVAKSSEKLSAGTQFIVRNACSVVDDLLEDDVWVQSQAENRQ